MSRVARRLCALAAAAVMTVSLTGCDVAGIAVYDLNLYVECQLGNTYACDQEGNYVDDENNHVFVDKDAPQAPENMRATVRADGAVVIDLDAHRFDKNDYRLVLDRAVQGTVDHLIDRVSTDQRVAKGSNEALEHHQLVDPAPRRGARNVYFAYAQDDHEDGRVSFPATVAVDVPAPGAPVPSATPTPGPTATPGTEPTATPTPSGPADTTPPARPQDVYNARNGYSIYIGWAPNREPDLRGYLVFRRSDPGPSQNAGTVQLTPEPITDTHIQDSLPLTGYADRYYTVYAVDTAGNRSEASVESRFEAYPSSGQGRSRHKAAPPNATLLLDGQATKQGTQTVGTGIAVKLRGATASGSWSLKPRKTMTKLQRALIAPLVRGTWTGTLDLALAPGQPAGAVNGTIRVKTRRGDRLCLKLDGAATFSKRTIQPAGTLTVLGGSGRLKRLHGSVTLGGSPLGRATASTKLTNGSARACR